MDLTKRQQEIFDFIKRYSAKYGYPPTVRDIGKAVGLASSSTVHAHLANLERIGLLRRDPSKPRAIELLDRAAAGMRGFVKPGLPLVGQVAAGTPIPPLESIQDRFPLPREMVGAEEGLFILTVSGDSMTGAGIRTGDMVVVRQLYERPQNGDIVAALFDGPENEGTIKVYKKVERHVWLMSQNPAYTPILGDKATIHGKVVAVLRQI